MIKFNYSMRVLFAAAISMLSLAAMSESAYVTGAGTPLSATARLDVQITIPKVLFLRVGTGNAFGAANNITVNLIDVTVPAANIGTGTAVAATAASGDLANGAVTARVVGNNGNITLTATNSGALTNGAAGDTISWSQISVATAAFAPASSGFSATILAHPAFNTAAGGGAGAATTLTAVNKSVLQEARWTYSYANSAVVAPGTYGGVNTNNGRVTYSASMP